MITKESQTDQTIYRYKNGNDEITITVFDRHDVPGLAAEIESNLKEELPRDADSVAYNNAVDGLESMLLAIASEGMDLSDNKWSSAIMSALDSLANQFV